MPYKNKSDYNRYLRDYMRLKRQVVKPTLLNPVKPESIKTPEVDADGNIIPEY